MKATFIRHKMDVAFLKIRRMCFPNVCFRVLFFDSFPCLRTDAFTVCVDVDKEERECIMLGKFIDGYDRTAYFFPVGKYMIITAPDSLKEAQYLHRRESDPLRWNQTFQSLPRQRMLVGLLNFGRSSFSRNI